MIQLRTRGLVQYHVKKRVSKKELDNLVQSKSHKTEENLSKAEKEKIKKEKIEKAELRGLSTYTKRKMTTIVENWCEMFRIIPDYAQPNLMYNIKKLAHITLTIPQMQNMTDVELKRRALNRFMVAMKRYTKNPIYFWRIEKQRNGNAHFHLCVDRYIEKEWISAEWYKIMTETIGVDLYHKKFGPKMPPSTKVKALSNKNFDGEYLVRDIGKEYQSKGIIGKRWGCHRDIRHLKYLTMFEYELGIIKLTDLNNKIRKTTVINDFVQYYHTKNDFSETGLHDLILHRKIEYYLKYAELIYGDDS